MARVFPRILEVQKADKTWERVNRGGMYAVTCYQTKWQAEYDKKDFQISNPGRKFRVRDLRKES